MYAFSETAFRLLLVCLCARVLVCCDCPGYSSRGRSTTAVPNDELVKSQEDLVAARECGRGSGSNSNAEVAMQSSLALSSHHTTEILDSDRQRPGLAQVTAAEGESPQTSAEDVFNQTDERRRLGERTSPVTETRVIVTAAGQAQLTVVAPSSGAAVAATDTAGVPFGGIGQQKRGREAEGRGREEQTEKKVRLGR